jgi:hypothetical protein
MNTIMLSIGAAFVCWLMAKAHSVKPPANLSLAAENAWLEGNVGRLRFWLRAGHLCVAVCVLRMLLHFTGIYSLFEVQ